MVIVDIYPDYFLHFCDGYAIQIYPAVYFYIRNRNLLLQLIIKVSFQYSIEYLRIRSFSEPKTPMYINMQEAITGEQFPPFCIPVAYYSNSVVPRL